MLFYSTYNRNLRVTLREAVLKGLADDKGLFMPEHIPQLSKEFFENIHNLDSTEISFQVANAILGEDISESKLKEIVCEALNFPIPLVKIKDHIYSLELFLGPTLAFKDVGARFMARLLSYFREEQKQDITVLVATSGDTGSAVANGFLGVEGIKVVILYPSGKVSDIQEKQLTTLGQNITALEVQGTFDDCQSMVKQAFSDSELNGKITLTSANSINVARLIPQTFYYFVAYAQLPAGIDDVVFSVPSGNYGNITAGLIAKRMGLPISRFIAATNVNDIVPKYLASGNFVPQPSVQTISNAMDVGNPSNFARMLDLYNNDLKAIRTDIVGYKFTDEETKNKISEIYSKQNYLLDPHGAVGYLALEKYLQSNASTGIFLETAHPSKFPEVVEKVIGNKISTPDRLAVCLTGYKESILVDNSFGALKEHLLG